MLLPINYHFAIHVLRSKKRENNISILLHFNRFFEGNFFRSCQPHQTKGTEYSTGYRVLPSTLENLHDLEKMWFLPLKELTVWGADNSQSKSWVNNSNLRQIPHPLERWWIESLWSWSNQTERRLNLAGNTFRLIQFSTSSSETEST